MPTVIDALVELGKITPQQAKEAESADRYTKRPVQFLIAKNIVSEKEVLEAISYSNPSKVVVATDLRLDPQAIMAIPGDMAKQRCVLPVSVRDNILTVVLDISNANDLELSDVLRRRAGASKINILLSSKTSIEQAIARAYRAENELKKIAKSEESDSQKRRETIDNANAIFEEQVQESAAARFVTLILQQGIEDGASDIHIEPTEHALYVRFRLDGVLHDITKAPIGLATEISSRIKVLAMLDIAERKKPQDGRLTLGSGINKTDLRVSVLPTVWGEKIVMRILDNSQASLDLRDLGFSEYNLARFESAYSKPHGMILVTGPTGSGKSTTLYAALNKISSSEKNVITIEDPVEYRISRINQIQVNARTGLTFPVALRSILRSDPDVILVGEIRDTDTAKIAVESATTGHLVLSTLHTNDAASAVERLGDMGVETFLVSSVLEAVLAQRLIRKLCNACKVQYTPDAEELETVNFPWKPGTPLPTIYHASENGCPECSKTGYKGRMAVHEVLILTPEIKHAATIRSHNGEVTRLAKENGMRTMREDGLEKVALGLTSIQEILRVVS